MDDKENHDSFIISKQNSPDGEKRVPLSSMSNRQQHTPVTPVMLNKLLKVAQYSPITPLGATCSQQPVTARSSKSPPAMVGGAKLLDSLGMNDVPINTLVYKRVTAMVEETKAHYEHQLGEKQDYIKQLEDQISSQVNMKRTEKDACSPSKFPLIGYHPCGPEISHQADLNRDKLCNNHTTPCTCDIINPLGKLQLGLGQSAFRRINPGKNIVCAIETQTEELAVSDIATQIELVSAADASTETDELLASIVTCKRCQSPCSSLNDAATRSDSTRDSVKFSGDKSDRKRTGIPRMQPTVNKPNVKATTTVVSKPKVIPAPSKVKVTKLATSASKQTKQVASKCAPVQKETLTRTAIDKQRREQIADLNRQIDNLEKENSKLIGSRNELKDIKEKQNILIIGKEEEVKTLQTSLEELQRELEEANQSYEKERQKLKDTLNDLEMKVKDFEEEKTKSEDKASRQRAVISSLKKDLEHSLQKQRELCEVQDQLETLKSEAKESEEFLKQEQLSLIESLQDCEGENNLLRSQLFGLENDFTNLQTETHQLRMSKQETDAELELVKAEAQRMLYSQEEEISQSFNELHSLSQIMVDLEKQLTTAAPHPLAQARADSVDAATEKHDEEGIDEAVAVPIDGNKPLSLVQQILSAVDNSSGTKKEAETIGSSELSAFSKVTKDKVTVTSNTDLAKTENGSSGSTVMKEEGEADERLNKKVIECKLTLTRLCQLNTALINTLMQQISCLEGKLSKSNAKNQRDTKRQEEEVKGLKETIKQAEKTEKQLRRRLDTSQQTLSDQKTAENELQQQLKDQIQALEGLAGKKREAENLESELKRVQRQLTQREGDLAISQQAMKDYQGNASHSLVEENTFLKQEVHRLKCEIMHVKEDAEAAIKKAMSRYRVVESNWKKSEAELSRLDDMIDDIRMALEPYSKMLVQLCSARVDKVMKEIGLSSRD